MTELSDPLPLAWPIAAVERDTGLPKDTLRVWERRYGFPRPQRDAAGERLYPMEQVQQLRALRRLLDAGHRPRHIVGLPLATLQALDPTPPDATAGAPAVRAVADPPLLALLRRHDAPGLQRALAEALAAQGPSGFVLDTAAPAIEAVGQAWIEGRLEVFEEHLFTQALQATLQHAAREAVADAPAGPPRVLLTTLPQEPHGLGLLMVQVLLACLGSEAIVLGPQLPVADILRAAQAYRADVLALSCTPLVPDRALQTGLQQLRQGLPPQVAVWVGGAHPRLRKALPAGVQAVADLGALPAAVQAWREGLRAAPAAAPARD